MIGLPSDSTPSWFVPQVGQGALALEARMDDLDTLVVLEQINDHDAFACVGAERAFLRELGLGCSIPAGAHATTTNGVLFLRGVMIGVDGSRSVRSSLEGTIPELLGTQLARRLRDEMGGSVLPGWGVPREDRAHERERLQRGPSDIHAAVGDRQ